MADPLLAQSAIDRLTSTCHELIVEGDSYRRRQRPATPPVDEPAQPHRPVMTAQGLADGSDQAGPALGRAGSMAFSGLSAMPWA
jgi:hypothetical protein